jgi:hypothetical protein
MFERVIDALERDRLHLVLHLIRRFEPVAHKAFSPRPPSYGRRHASPVALRYVC